MAGRPGMLPKLDMGAVKDKDAKEKARTPLLVPMAVPCQLLDQ